MTWQTPSQSGFTVGVWDSWGFGVHALVEGFEDLGSNARGICSLDFLDRVSEFRVFRCDRQMSCPADSCCQCSSNCVSCVVSLPNPKPESAGFLFYSCYKPSRTMFGWCGILDLGLENVDQ